MGCGEKNMGLMQKFLSFFCCSSYKKKKNLSEKKYLSLVPAPINQPTAPPLRMAKSIQTNSKTTKSPQLTQHLNSESWKASTWFHYVCFASGCTTLMLTLARCIYLTPMACLWLWFELTSFISAFTAYLLADLASGVYHWAIDNYGSSQTPIFGPQIEIFLVHHMHPLAITKRHVSRLLHVPSIVITVVIIPINMVSSNPLVLLFVQVFSYCILFSQLFHMWAHTPKQKLPKVVVMLQDIGVLVGRAEHARHHKPPFDSHYCIVSGVWNGILDRSGFFSGLERMIYKGSGIKPRSWSGATFE